MTKLIVLVLHAHPPPEPLIPLPVGTALPMKTSKGVLETASFCMKTLTYGSFGTVILVTGLLPSESTETRVTVMPEAPVNTALLMLCPGCQLFRELVVN